MGRFDFVVYEKQGRSELPILAIELDGKEHFEDAVVKERDRKKNAICKAHNMELSGWKTHMREDIIISKEY